MREVNRCVAQCRSRVQIRVSRPFDYPSPPTLLIFETVIDSIKASMPVKATNLKHINSLQYGIGIMYEVKLRPSNSRYLLSTLCT